MMFNATKVDEWNVVDGRKIDSHSNEHINIAMELKVDLIKLRAPIVNTPINMVAKIEKNDK